MVQEAMRETTIRSGPDAGTSVAGRGRIPLLERWRPGAPAATDLFEQSGNRAPPGASVLPIRTADGVVIRAARFEPAPGVPAAGTVCLFQGRGEQVEKYFGVIRRLQQRGLCVATFDWRGQGGSQRLTRDPRKGHVADFLHYERDIDAFRRVLALPDCRPPFFGLGHSMGGHIMLRAAPRLTPWLSRMVLTSPFLDFGSAPLSRRTMRMASGAMRWTGFGRNYIPGPLRKYARTGGFENNPLTSDPAMFDMMMSIGASRPDLSISAPTVGWINAAARSIAAIEHPRFAERVRIPSLLVNAGEDIVVSVRAVERMARRLRGASYVLVPGARHELMMERDRYAAQFWAAFDAFVPGEGPV